MRKTVLVIALLLPACTVTRHTVPQGPAAEPPPQQSSQRRILQPEVERPVGRVPREQMPLYYEDRGDSAGAYPLPEGWPERRFTAWESSDVRVPAANPLPPGGLKFDLGRLSANFCYPYMGNRISDYGMRSGSMHTGVDIRAIPNDTIRAAFEGIVRMSKSYGNYGNTVVIQHPYGFETLYAHNSRNLVEVNERVGAGQPVALAGRTGRATTEHLHFEVRATGEHINPNLLFDCAGRKLQGGELVIVLSGGRVVASNPPLAF